MFKVIEEAVSQRKRQRQSWLWEELGGGLLEGEGDRRECHYQQLWHQLQA